LVILAHEIILNLQTTNWASLLKDLGIFESARQARKNGWEDNIAYGWHEIRFKAKRIVIFLLREAEVCQYSFYSQKN
jgi:hypothetical protein